MNFFKSLLSKKPSKEIKNDENESKALKDKEVKESNLDNHQDEEQIYFTSEATEANQVRNIEVSMYNANNIGKSQTGNSLILFKSPEYDIDFFAVLNPHGLSGKEISSFLIVFIQNYIAENVKKIAKMSKDSEIEEFLVTMISKANQELLNNGIDLNFSGTTLTCLLILKNTVYVSWIGNSKAIMFRKISEEKKYAIELTVDHVPDNREERYRIFENGGIVQRISVKNKEQGPLRVWEGRIENGPGLHITRSLGDTKSKKLGVISDPEVQHIKLKNVWSLIYSTQMSYYVNKFLTKSPDQFQTIAKSIIKKMNSMWSKISDISEVINKVDVTTFDPNDSCLIIIKLTDDV